MTRKTAVRVLIASLLLVTTVSVVPAFLDSPTANVLRFTSSPARSTVDVLVHATTCCNQGTLYVGVVGPNGVTQSVSRQIGFPSGTTLYKVNFPYGITGVRYTRVLTLN